jgi:hypothetical protein
MTPIASLRDLLASLLLFPCPLRLHPDGKNGKAFEDVPPLAFSTGAHVAARVTIRVAPFRSGRLLGLCGYGSAEYLIRIYARRGGTTGGGMGVGVWILLDGVGGSARNWGMCVAFSLPKGGGKRGSSASRDVYSAAS